MHREVYFNPTTNNTWLEGDTIYNFELADTLEKLSKAPDFADEFYEGSIGRELLEKIERLGGILTSEDLANYQPRWEKPTHWTMQNTYDVYSTSEFSDNDGNHPENASGYISSTTPF